MTTNPRTSIALKDATVADLVAELNSRSGVVASVWTQDDFLTDINSDMGGMHNLSQAGCEALDALSEEERSDLADAFLVDDRKHFEQALAQAGNNYITENLPEFVKEFLSETQGIAS